MLQMSSQKAPSAKRCIKTRRTQPSSLQRCSDVRKHRAPKSALRRLATAIFENLNSIVRKHRAPKGALRPGALSTRSSCDCPVRKHQAPKGALRRLLAGVVHVDLHGRQKAPSAKRRIETRHRRPFSRPAWQVRKHRAPKGALRHIELESSLFALSARKHRAP